MKGYFFLFTMFFITFSACRTTKEVAINALPFCTEKNISNELCHFLSSFKDAVEQHEKKSLLRLMDQEYKTNQHDRFLKGRTDQFLSEFLAGKKQSDGQYLTPDINKIEQIEFQDITLGIYGYELRFQIHYQHEILENDCLIVIAKKNKQTTLGLVGASG